MAEFLRRRDCEFFEIRIVFFFDSLPFSFDVDFVFDETNIFVFQILVVPILNLANRPANKWLHLRNLGPL